MFTASEELAQDAVYSVNSRGRIVIGGVCASFAYLTGAGMLERRFRMCNLFTELHLVLLTTGGAQLIGSRLLLLAAYKSFRGRPAFSGLFGEFGFALPALRALLGQ